MDDDTLHTSEMPETSKNFEDVYNTHAGAIYKFMFWRTKDVQTSQDLTSTTFQKAWASRQSFKEGSQRAWLYRIARNTLFDYWRKVKDISIDNTDELEADESTTTAERIDRQFEVEKLKVAMTKLPDDMRAVIRLRFIDGLPVRQVAKQLGLTEGNVRIIQYRALKRLRKLLR